jgi:hypothetical protein
LENVEGIKEGCVLVLAYVLTTLPMKGWRRQIEGRWGGGTHGDKGSTKSNKQKRKKGSTQRNIRDDEDSKDARNLAKPYVFVSLASSRLTSPTLLHLALRHAS